MLRANLKGKKSISGMRAEQSNMYALHLITLKKNIRRNVHLLCPVFGKRLCVCVEGARDIDQSVITEWEY